MIAELETMKCGKSTVVDELHVKCGLCRAVMPFQLTEGVKRMRHVTYFKSRESIYDLIIMPWLRSLYGVQYEIQRWNRNDETAERILQAQRERVIFLKVSFCHSLVCSQCFITECLVNQPRGT